MRIDGVRAARLAVAALLAAALVAMMLTSIENFIIYKIPHCVPLSELGKPVSLRVHIFPAMRLKNWKVRGC